MFRTLIIDTMLTDMMHRILCLPGLTREMRSVYRRDSWLAQDMVELGNRNLRGWSFPGMRGVMVMFRQIIAPEDDEENQGRARGEGNKGEEEGTRQLDTLSDY